jgi:hypothetical protein
MNLLIEPLLEYLALPTIEIKQPSARLLETVDRCLDLALKGNQNWDELTIKERHT